MKLVRYLASGAGGPAVGIVDGDSVAEVPASGGEPGPCCCWTAPGLNAWPRRPW